MSTEHQQYSIDNQSDVILKYATDHNMEVVRTYSDAGKSGLTLQHRDGLQALIAEVENGSADYSVVLVYDVSRWGRFQDVDESAYYEYRCKRAKISVHYCAEQFANDGSVSSALLKAIKRTMAGEYSRELSAKVFAGKCRLAEAGFRQGGPPGYGLRRLLVDQHGNPKGTLKRGEFKSLTTDRILQILGPPEEVQVIHDIYRMFVQDRLIPAAIAERLNERGIMSEYGRDWTRAMIQTIVTNPKYVGANVLNRKSYKLGGTGKRNPRTRWLIRENTFEPIIDVDTFRQAQEVVASRSLRYTDQYMLDSLKGLLDRTGKVSVALIDADPKVPHSRTYTSRFGSLYESYRRIGYEHGRRIPIIDLSLRVRAYRRKLLSTIVDELVAEGASVKRDLRSGKVTINGEFTLRLATALCLEKPVGYRWAFRMSTTMTTDITVVARMVPGNNSVLDYFVLPTTGQWPSHLTVAPEDDLFLGIYRFDDLSFLKRLVRRATVKEKE